MTNEKNQARRRNFHHVKDDRVVMESVLDDVKLLKNENESLRHDVNNLKDYIKILRGEFKTLRKSTEEHHSANDVAISVEDVPADCPLENVIRSVKSTAAEGEGTSTKKKRRNNKKNKGNNNNLTNSWSAAATAASGSFGNVSVVGASNMKIVAGFISIALMVSIAFGQQGILGRTSNNPLLWEQESGQSGTHSNGAHPDIVLGDNEETLHVGVSLPTNQDGLTVIEEALPQREQKSGQSVNSQKIDLAVASPKLRYVGDPSVEDLIDLVLPAAQHDLGIVVETSRNLRALDDSSAKSKRRDDVGVARDHGLRNLDRDYEGGATTMHNDAPDDGSAEGDEASNTRNLEVKSLFSSSHATISSPSPSSILFFPLQEKIDDDISSAPTANPALPIVASNRPSLDPEIMDDASVAQSASLTGYELTEFSKGVNFYNGYVCDANPETCGCPNLLQTDYRGTISKTVLGYPCEKWDTPLIKVVWGNDYPEQFPNADLDNNYCRNPGDDEGAYCFVAGGHGFGYCDVPVCGSLTESPTSTSIPTSSTVPTGSLSSSILPSSSSSPTRVCPVADREVCGCDVVRQSDYRGTISVTKDGFDCIGWDSELAKELDYKADYVRDFPNAGLEGNNYCRNPGNLDSGPFCMTPFPTTEGVYIRSCDIPKCDPCACTPQCEKSNDADCGCPSVSQADTCCEEDDARCKCHYLKEACSKSLEGKSTEFCEDASVACCDGSIEGDNECKCAMHEQICMDFPSQSSCDYAAEVCCKTDQCYCDFYTYSTTFSITQSDDKAIKCSQANERQFISLNAERLLLTGFYNILGGEYWINSAGWLNDTVHQCDWFGIQCNGERRVIEITLRDNNLQGELLNDYPAILPALAKFDLAGNKISGNVRYSDYLLDLRQLDHFDVSRNSLTGHVDMTFPPSTSHVNISHNNVTSIGFKRFNPAFETLRMVDLSNNHIDLDASTFFFNIPPNIEKLVLSNNMLKGALPNPFPLPIIGVFMIDNNAISGALPDFPAPRLKTLDVSNQNKREHDGGLSGSIPTTLSNLIDLTVLNLAGNKFTQRIPHALGNLHFLQVLNLSSNALDKSIPSELETLKDFLEVLDLSSNKLTGSIPRELVNFQDTLLLNLRENSNLLGPASLDLCFLPGFDLSNNASFCPPERNALREFYESTKGFEWTESKLWLDPVISHCDWFGVTCEENSTNTIKLELSNNGLSGKLSEEIALLTHLEFLDLSDNDIKGSIPTEIRNLSHLKHFRLCYNGFIGNETNFGHLQDLELIQIHGNRLSGTIPMLHLPFSDRSSFVSDCGNPSDFEPPLVCDECTMCCNAQGDCHSTHENFVQKTKFQNYLFFSFAFFGMLFAASGVLASAVYAHDRHRNRGLPESSVRCPSYKDKDRKYALSTIGNDSVYQFFLRNSWQGWIIVLLTLTAQFWLLFIFVEGAENSWTDEDSDLVYTWQCRRDEVECVNTNETSETGWIAFVILMIAHLLKDIINGTKLIVLSAKQRHSHYKRARFFVGGTLLTTVSLFTLYVSTIYNYAIATNDREIIENSVIILFICDIDEMLFGILMVINEDWVRSMSIEEKENNQDAAVETSRKEIIGSLKEESRHETNQTLALEDQTGAVSSLNDEVQSLKTVVGALQETVRQQNEQLMRLIPPPRYEHDCASF